MTILQLSALKKIDKGSTLLLMDRTGGASKDVARELTRLGFRKALVMSGGFAGAYRRVARALGSSYTLHNVTTCAWELSYVRQWP